MNRPSLTAFTPHIIGVDEALAFWARQRLSFIQTHGFSTPFAPYPFPQTRLSMPLSRSISTILLAGAFGLISAGLVVSVPTDVLGGVPPTAKTPPDTSRPALDLDALTTLIHKQVNDARKENQRSSLSYRHSIEPLAKIHSEDMAERNFFAHQDPDGNGLQHRVSRLGLSCDNKEEGSGIGYGFGENLFRGTLYRGYREIYKNDRKVKVEYDWHSEESLAETIVKGWMNSPGHRKNLLNRQYDHEAVYVATNGVEYYVTQVFC